MLVSRADSAERPSSLAEKRGAVCLCLVIRTWRVQSISVFAAAPARILQSIHLARGASRSPANHRLPAPQCWICSPSSSTTCRYLTCRRAAGLARIWPIPPHPGPCPTRRLPGPAGISTSSASSLGRPGSRIVSGSYLFLPKILSVLPLGARGGFSTLELDLSAKFATEINVQ